MNSVHPTGVDTPPAHSGFAPGAITTFVEETPKLGPILVNMLPKEILDPRDISNAVLFLASDEAKYVTGLQMKVDAEMPHI